MLVVAVSAQATLYSYDIAGGSAIPDGTPIGITSSTNINLGALTGDTTSQIVNVDVRLNITGGYNGDLYGYLVLQSADGSTTTSILLNRVGRNAADDSGSATFGFGSITLSGNTGTDIHLATGATDGGTYLADGRTLSPTGSFAGANATPGTAGLNILDGHNANGTWTLFLADVSGGDVSTLVSWGLDISVVPEPITYALMIFGAVVMTVAMRRRLAAR